MGLPSRSRAMAIKRTSSPTLNLMARGAISTCATRRSRSPCFSTRGPDGACRPCCARKALNPKAKSAPKTCASQKITRAPTGPGKSNTMTIVAASVRFARASGAPIAIWRPRVAPFELFFEPIRPMIALKRGERGVSARRGIFSSPQSSPPRNRRDVAERASFIHRA